MDKFELVKSTTQDESNYALFYIGGTDLKVRISKSAIPFYNEVYATRYSSYCTEEESEIVSGMAVKRFIYLLTGVDIYELDIYDKEEK